MIVPTDIDKGLILQNVHNTKTKLEVLDENFHLVQEIDGITVSMSASISATSDIRRTCALTIVPMGSNFNSENFDVTYLDRVIRVSIGLYNDAESDYTWYLIGTFLLNTDSYSYDATRNELSMQLVDMMSATMDVRGSQIGHPVLIPFESNVRGALISTVARFSPFKFYDVDEFPDVVPFDQEFGVGTYPHEILKQILDLFPYYQMFYSNDGTFTVKPIPTGTNDALLVDREFMDKIIISENRSGSLSNIKNTTEIWGAELDSTYTASNTTTTGNTYSIVHGLPVSALSHGTMFSFTPTSSSVAGQMLKVDALGALPLKNHDGSALPAGAMAANRMYTVKYVDTLDGTTQAPQFLLQGESLIHVIVKEVNVMPDAAYIADDKVLNGCNDIKYIVNPESPFACDRGGMGYNDGEIRQVLSGGDYSIIYTTQLAYERAAYENWLKTRLQTDAEIECLLVPWMDVNTKIEYTSPITGIARQYIVKEIDMNFSDFTMTLKLSRFYPYYPWL